MNTLAISALDPTLQGVLFLAAVILFVIATVLTRSLVTAGLASATTVFAWNAFAAA